MLSKGLQNYTNLQHKFLHMGLTPSPLYTMCKKTSDLAEDGFPFSCLYICLCICVCLCVCLFVFISLIINYQGKDYFWCHTASSWDYCSPEPEKVEERTCNGFTCNGVCAKMDKSFLFCETKIANRITGGDWWDYCWKDKNQCKASRDADRHSANVSLVVRWVLITLFFFLPILCCCIVYWTQC